MTKDYMSLVHGLKNEAIKRCMERAAKEKRTMCPEYGLTNRLKGRYL